LVGSLLRRELLQVAAQRKPNQDYTVLLLYHAIHPFRALERTLAVVYIKGADAATVLTVPSEYLDVVNYVRRFFLLAVC
jgi:hypothetical protein